MEATGALPLAAGATDGCGGELRRYLAARGAGRLLLATSALALASLVVGVYQLPVMVQNGVPTGSPLWTYLPIVSAAMIATAGVGKLEGFDAVATRPIACYNAAFTAGAMAVIALVSLAAGMLGGLMGVSRLSWESGLVLGIATARNIAGWTGLVALAGRVIGHRFSWIPAVALIAPMEWLGRADGITRPWAFASAEPTVALSWAIAILLAGAGVGATAISTWRMRQFANRHLRILAR